MAFNHTAVLLGYNCHSFSIDNICIICSRMQKIPVSVQKVQVAVYS